MPRYGLNIAIFDMIRYVVPSLATDNFTNYWLFNCITEWLGYVTMRLTIYIIKGEMSSAEPMAIEADGSKQADRFQGMARRTRCVVCDTAIWYVIRMQHRDSDIWLKQQLLSMTIWARADKEHVHLGQLD